MILTDHTGGFVFAFGTTKRNAASDPCNGYESKQSVYVIKNNNIEPNTNVKPPLNSFTGIICTL